MSALFDRYVCPRCTKALRIKVTSPAPTCSRCTGLCKIESASQEQAQNKGTQILRRAMPRIMLEQAFPEQEANRKIVSTKTAEG